MRPGRRQKNAEEVMVTKKMEIEDGGKETGKIERLKKKSTF